MSETLSFREVKLEGGWLMVKPEREDLGKAMAIVRKHKDKLYDLEVKEHRKKRSNDANSMMWALVNKISEVMHIPPTEIYRGYIPDIPNNYWIAPVKPEEIEERTADWCRDHIGRMTEDMGACRSEDLKGYHNLKMYRGSSEYNTAQFSRLLELVIQDCHQLGIETMSDREKSLLLEEWEKTHEG